MKLLEAIWKKCRTDILPQVPLVEYKDVEELIEQHRVSAERLEALIEEHMAPGSPYVNDLNIEAIASELVVPEEEPKLITTYQEIVDSIGTCSITYLPALFAIILTRIKKKEVATRGFVDKTADKIFGEKEVVVPEISEDKLMKVYNRYLVMFDYKFEDFKELVSELLGSD